ncbi:MAG: hypothetical protein BZ138_00815 [Methanosphaera sp. rholeuAM270]|nr:MAG: hypothetical protein BZ138_00815 [Methanosphaera sp. rholeuAM270]
MNLIVYYSRTNTTRKVSEIIADKKGGELVEITDKKNRSGAIGFAVGGFDSIRGNKTEISYEKTDLSDYDTVYIGTPVWASRPTPAILQFIDENDFSDVNVVTFATMKGNDNDNTVNIMNDIIESKGGLIKGSFSLSVQGKDLEELVNNALNNE